MKKFNLLLLSLLFYTLTGLGISLTIVAQVGVSSFNALNLSLAHLFSLKIGSMTAIVNGLFLLLYIILTKGKLISSYLIQIMTVLALGYVINFFTYQVFTGLTINSYANRLGLFLLGSLIAGFGTGMVLNLKVLSFPIESVCQHLSAKWHVSFATLRYSVDIISVSLSLMVSFVNHSPVFVREGTLISLLVLTMTISLTKKAFNKLITTEHPNRLLF